MADPQLTEADWKKFAKGRSLKDAAVLKALDALQASDASAQLAALDDLDKQLDGLAKAHKTDKAVTEHLAALAKVMKARRKQTELAMAAAEDDDSPALLTTKMIPLLRQVAGGATCQAGIAVLSKQTLVLVSRRTVGPSQRKLMTTELGTTAGVKFLTGQCLFEKSAHTFVLETKIAGLAKRLKAALHAQTGLRLKVRVRGPDQDDVDEDLDDTADAAAAADTGNDVPVSDVQSTETGATPLPLVARLGEARARVQQAVRDQHPQATKLNALLAFASSKVDAGDFTAADQALAALAPLIAGLAAGTESATRSRTGAVNYAKARLAWLAARKKAQAEIEGLRQAIRSAFAPGATSDDAADDELSSDDAETLDDAPDLDDDIPSEFPDLEERLLHLDRIMVRLDESLADTLDDALNAAEDDRRLALNRQAQAQIADFLGYVESEPLLLNLDDNPFLPVTVQATLQATLRTLAATLKV